MKTPRFAVRPIVPAAVALSLIVTLILPPSLAVASSLGATASIDPAGSPAQSPGDTCAGRSAVAPADWPIVLCDSFDSNPDKRWTTGISSDDNAISSRTIVDGKYRWQQKALKGFLSYVKYLDATLSDFFVAVDGRVVSGPETAQYGLSFRQMDNNNYYAFQIREQGQYRVDVLIDGNWTTLSDWTDTTAIRAGQVNRLAVKGAGNAFTLYINDETVSNFTDDKLLEGLVAINTTLNAGEEALFEFDDLELRAPAPTPTPTATLAPTATPTPRPTRAPTTAPETQTPTAGGTCEQDASVAPQDWPLGVCDSFADNQYGWPAASSSTQYGKVTWELSSGIYRWNVQATSGFYQ